MRARVGDVVLAAMVAFVAGVMVANGMRGDGRYQLVTLSGGSVARLDTATGQIVGCAADRETWPAFACPPSPGR